VKRGYYEAEFEVLAENTVGIPNYEITNLFLRRVEAQIVEALEFYLWTQKMETQRQKT
jgi:KDO2-lipid IV(A) lauroyltransferase